MITYNPKDWFTLIFQFHKSDTFRRLLPTMMAVGLVTGVACYLERKYMQGTVPALTIFHQIAGFIISLVLVFRINTAYDRWWEGRKHWGSLVNNCRNLAIRLNAIIPADDRSTRATAQQMIAFYPFAVKEVLRTRSKPPEVVPNELLTAGDIAGTSHLPNLIASRLTSYCLEICKKYSSSPHDYLVMSDNLGSLTDLCGSCERIKSTPIPYAYSIFIKKVIFLYIITMPVSFGLTLGYWAIPIVMIMFYAFASLELISEEIEDPFGTDSNDLPTDDLSARIAQNTREILNVS